VWGLEAEMLAIVRYSGWNVTNGKGRDRLVQTRGRVCSSSLHKLSLPDAVANAHLRASGAAPIGAVPVKGGEGTPGAPSAGEASAFAAAQAVAREHGVACDEAVRIAAGSNVLVHLKPAPVVARVMTGTALLHDDVEQWLAREVAVAAFLAERTDLVVPPSDVLPPGPHERDGLWMTLWKFVPHDVQAPPPGPREMGHSLRGLHAALSDFPGDLAPLSEVRDWLKRLLAELRPTPPLTQRDTDWLRFKLDALTPAVFETALPAQALHGDASMSNLLRTESGLVWNDLEDVCAGPVAWDICGLVASARARGRSARFIEELLAAYGDPGVEDLEAFLEAHALYEVVWQAFEGRRRPRAMKRAAAGLALLREGRSA
jgi:Phosphotransferase enzyme family